MRKAAWILGIAVVAVAGVGCFLMRKSTFLSDLEKEHALAKDVDVASAERLVEEALGRLYNPAGQEDFLLARTQLEQAAVALAHWSAGHASDAGGHYRRAKATQALGEWFEVARDSKRWELQVDEDSLLACFEGAVAASKKACALDDRNGDAHRLWGDTLGHMIRYKGVPFAIMNGSESRKQIQRALEIDPNSSEACLALGRFYFFTPESFGGNKDEAVASFRKGLDLAQGSHQQFLARIWLAQALAKKGQSAEARELLQQALGIYPNNDWAQSLLKGM